MTALIFWISLMVVFYVYVGYPLTAWLLGLFWLRPVLRQPIRPKVSILIAAFNEEEAIAATIENKLALDYPQELLEIVVVSDESTDATDSIVQTYADRGVRLLRQTPRAGKTAALNLAVPQAAGDILVFSDANSLYAPDALGFLVQNFADPEVGYVTGKMIYVSPDGSTVGDGCSSYMRYENRLRELETRLGSVVGVDGGIDAMRKDLYRSLNPDQLPDFVQPLKVVEQGFRVVYDSRALLRESTLKATADEYRMRVRVSLRAFWALYDMRTLLGFSVNPLFAWQLWSHKVLRYLCFVFLAAAWLSNLLLLEDGLFYQVFFFFQSAGYAGAAAIPYLGNYSKWYRLLAFGRYFVLLNLAAAHAFGKFLLGKKQIVWTPRKG
ncbi:glycosyltransferase family 2 protein [Desulfuromonas sp. AOP6]|uniref:glycosyltransferase family 2 protein n=1 Tax=Desulfuromonas sp. AOP6 TaxID=1566351 RepID=UPI00126FDF70|nr:glycosyltransferase family 2 protein [Desulfuromonas sp. AOP6]BCA79494.1 glycosyl transferase [Desulfuromonas sp. AOP6]